MIRPGASEPKKRPHDPSYAVISYTVCKQYYALSSKSRKDGALPAVTQEKASVPFVTANHAFIRLKYYSHLT